MLTNNHVIADATSIKVDIGGTGNTHTAKVIGYDVADDVALIKIRQRVEPEDGELRRRDARSQSATRSSRSATRSARAARPTVTQGKVTALDQEVTAGDRRRRPETLAGMIQIDAPIQPGDSGGALVDAERQGHRHEHRRGGRRPLPPADRLEHRLRDPDRQRGQIVQPDPDGHRDRQGPHRRPGAARRAGAQSDRRSDAPVTSGALVVGVEDDTGAKDAGIQTGDVVVAIDGKPIADEDALHSRCRSSTPATRSPSAGSTPWATGTTRASS